MLAERSLGQGEGITVVLDNVGHRERRSRRHQRHQRTRATEAQLHFLGDHVDRATPEIGSQRERADVALQDRALPAVRGERLVQVRRQVSVCARLRRAAQSRASPQVQDRAVPHLPHNRLLPVRAALSLYTQLRGGTHTQSEGECPTRLDAAEHHRPEPVDERGSRCCSGDRGR